MTVISIHMDSFHMNIGEPNPAASAKKFAAKNSVFHISGSNREGITQGNIDFKAHFAALDEGGFNGPSVLELILKGNPVNTPPRNDKKMAELSAQLMESANIWRGYASAGL